MHIAEGVLSPEVLGIGAVLAAIGTIIGLRRLEGKNLVTAAMLSSVFFNKRCFSRTVVLEGFNTSGLITLWSSVAPINTTKYLTSCPFSVSPLTIAA